MALQYKVIIQAEEPISSGTGSVWIQTTSIYTRVHIMLAAWVVITESGPLSSVTEGIYDRDVIKQDFDPASPNVGDMWLNTAQNQVYIYLDNWQLWAAA